MRLDHAYGIQMTSDMDTHENLHGGLRADQGEHQYQWANGRMWNGLIVIMYALEDVNPGGISLYRNGKLIGGVGVAGVPADRAQYAALVAA